VTERWPVRARIALAVAGVLLLAAFVDYQLTSGTLPELGPSATPDDPAFGERDRLADGYVTRAWCYGFPALGAFVVAVVLALRGADERRRRELFTDVGVAGVVVGALAWLASSREPSLLSDSSGGALFALVPVSMLVVAGVGGVSVRVGEGGGPSDLVRGMPLVAKVAVALAGLTVVAVWAGHSEHECGADNPGWVDAAIFVAVPISLAAAGFGLAALFRRRWIAALVSLPAPILALVSVLAAACLA
jgi:hypothetical protein